jgi:hypothetical protein
MNILHYRAADRMPAVHFGYWPEVLWEWAEQGHISRELAEGAAWDGSPAQRELDRILGWDCNWFTTVIRTEWIQRSTSRNTQVLNEASYSTITFATFSCYNTFFKIFVIMISVKSSTVSQYLIKTDF